MCKCEVRQTVLPRIDAKYKFIDNIIKIVENSSKASTYRKRNKDTFYLRRNSLKFVKFWKLPNIG